MHAAPTASEVEARSVGFHAGLAPDRVDVTLAEQHVALAVQLHLRPFFGVEQDPVADDDGPDVRPSRSDCLGPGQAAAPHRCGGRDHDAGAGTTFTFAAVEPARGCGRAAS